MAAEKNVGPIVRQHRYLKYMEDLEILHVLSEITVRATHMINHC